MKLRFLWLISFLPCLASFAGESTLEPKMVQLDTIKIWSVKPHLAEGWKDAVRRFKPMAHKILKPEKA